MIKISHSTPLFYYTVDHVTGSLILREDEARFLAAALLESGEITWNE